MGRGSETCLCRRVVIRMVDISPDMRGMEAAVLCKFPDMFASIKLSTKHNTTKVVLIRVALMLLPKPDRGKFGLERYLFDRLTKCGNADTSAHHTYYNLISSKHLLCTVLEIIATNTSTTTLSRQSKTGHELKQVCHIF